MARGKSKASLELIDACHKILSAIKPATVRAVCYQLFVRRLIPDMSKASTNRVSRQLVYAREQCMIPWAWIVDETRELERPGQWKDLPSFSETVRRVYRRDRWVDQPRFVEVWSEKGTVRGTLGPVLREYGVGFRVMHGFAAATTVQEVFELTEAMEQPMIAFYVGDHDPSGRHMSDVDLPSRLERYYAKVELRRLAMLPPQFRDLPCFSATEKKADTRYQWFVRNHGLTCCELDALSPAVLRGLVNKHIRGVIDWERWNHHQRIEAVEFESLDAFTKALRDAAQPPN